jgi:hypothetical protein
MSRITAKPNFKLYWTEDPVFGMSIFSNTMTLNHFESILSILHFSDSSTYNTNTDRLYIVTSISSTRQQLAKHVPERDAINIRCWTMGSITMELNKFLAQRTHKQQQNPLRRRFLQSS